MQQVAEAIEALEMAVDQQTLDTFKGWSHFAQHLAKLHVELEKAAKGLV